MLIDKIKDHLGSLKSDRDPSKIGMSALGKCQRQLAYKRHGVSGRPLDWRAQVIFNDGDMAHEQIRGWLRGCLDPRTAGVYLSDEEKLVHLFTPGGIAIFGHVDGVIKSLSGGQDRLLEIKSMGSYSYDKLVKGSEGAIDESYIVQLSAYLRGTGLKECIFLAKCKDTGELHEQILEANNALLDKALERYDKIHSSSRPEEIERPYKPKDKKGTLPWMCGYCPFVSKCWEEHGPKEVKRNVFVLQNYDV